jgi:hypothetical protein
MKHIMNPPTPPLDQDEIVSLEPPLLCRISSAMKQLAVSRTTIYRMVASGQLELVHISTHTSRITSDSIRRLIQQQTASTTLSTCEGAPARTPGPTSSLERRSERKEVTR